MSYTLLEINEVNSRYSKAAFDYQERRHADWTANYTLYRDKVLQNRLTQRQSINIPLMKYVLKSALKEVDDPVDLYFRNRDNDKQKEIYFNAFWDVVRRDQKIDVRDIGDKKQVLMYGRSSSDWNIDNGKVLFEIDDPFDVFYDQYTDPFDFDGTCHFMEHRHIFKTLASLEHDDRYDKDALEKVKAFFGSEAGLARSSQNAQSMTDKNQRLSDMGLATGENPEVGETYVEISKRWTRLWSEEYNMPCIYYSVYCEGHTLYSEEHEKVVGSTQDNYWRDHFTKTTWADEVERADIYTDGLCDMVRPINLVCNAMISQIVENRTLKNFSMQYYDASEEDFVPQTFEPVPWGWYPIKVPAGKRLGDTVQPIPVGDLSDSLPELQFLISIAEKAAATSSTQSGQVNQNKVTLGEVELVLAEAKDRLKTMSNYYVPAWEERGTKFVKLIEAAGHRIKAVKDFKKGYEGNMFGVETSPDDWYTPNGYSIEVTNKTDMKNRSIEMINTLGAVKASMPNNLPLQDVYERKMLDMVPDLTPMEIKKITDFQKKLREMPNLGAQVPGMMGGDQGGAAMPGAPQPVPQVQPNQAAIPTGA